MTKLRVPHTWHDAVTRIADRIGWDGAATATGKSVTLVRDWSDPARGRLPSLEQALALSTAYAAAGGEDAPFIDAFAFQIDVRVVGLDPCRRALASEIADLARELGDTIAAALKLTDPASSTTDAHCALSEGQQCEAALDNLMRRIATFFPTGAGPGSGTTGGYRS